MVLGAYYYRIDGVISVRLATGLFMSFCSMMAVQELIGTPVSKQLLAPWRPVACASIMALVIRSSDKWLMNLSIEGWAIDEAAEVVARRPGRLWPYRHGAKDNYDVCGARISRWPLTRSGASVLLISR